MSGRHSGWCLPLRLLLATAALIVPTVGSATVNSVEIGIDRTGTAPFDADDAAGHDSSGTNAVLRTRDINSYTVTLDLNGPENGAYFILSQPAGTTPGSYTGPAITTWQQWAQPSSGGPLTSCANFVAGVVTTASTSSGWLDAAHTQLKCYVGNIPAGSYEQSFNFSGQVPVVPNGSTLPGAVVSYCSTTTVCTSGGTVSPVAQTPVQPPGGVPLNGAQLATETISATPQWDLVTGGNQIAFVAGSGPAGEDGFVYLLRFQQWPNNSNALGIEALGQQPITVTDDVSGVNAQARLVTWAISNLPFSGLNSVPANALGCSGNQACAEALDSGPAASSAGNTVPNGGSCSATQPGGPGTPLAIQLSGADYTVPRLLTAAVCGSGYPQGPLGAHAVSKQILLWIPVAAVPMGTTSVTNRLVATSSSATGVTNPDPGNSATPAGASGNNINTVSVVNTPSVYHNKAFQPLGTNSLDLAGETQQAGFSSIVFAMAGQYAGSRLTIGNSGTTSFANVVICEKVDNARTTIVDPAVVPGTPAPATTPAVQGILGSFKPNRAGGVVLALNSPQTPSFTVEYGIGGVNGVGDTWATYNTVADPFQSPSGSSAQGTGTCAQNQSTGSVWYTLSDLQNNTIPGGAQAITKVRVTVSTLAPNQEFNFLLPFQVLPTYAYSGTDLAPGTAFTAGAPTANAIVPNRSSAVFPGLPTSPIVGSDALQIRYATTLSAGKGVQPAGLIQPGAVLRYIVSGGYSTPGYPRAETLIYTDPLPAGVTYLPGSSIYGSTPIADPVIQADTPTVGRQTLVWTIPGIVPSHPPAASNMQLLFFNAQVGFQFTQGQVISNTARINELSGGAPANSGSATNTIDAPAGLRFSKTTSTPNVEQNQPFRYTVDFSAASITPINFELIDVLPYNADGRTPPSVVTGGYSNVVVTPAPGNPAPASNVLYTRHAAATINTNPYAAGAHSKNGSGTNSASLTVWCTAAQFGSGDCPATIAQATAFLIAMHPFDAAGNPQGTTPLPVNNVYSFDVVLTPAGNAYGNVYTNQARASSSDSSLPPVSSPFATVRVVPSSIAGTVYNDTNGSGTQDPGENGIAGVTVTLSCIPTLGGPPVNLTTTTVANGSYSFPNLPSGTCTITETQPANATTTFNTVGTAGGTVGPVGGATEQISGIVIVTGENTTGYNFGEASPSAALNVNKSVSGAAAPGNWSFTLSTATPGCSVPASAPNPSTAPGGGGTAPFSGLQVWSQTTPNTRCVYSVAENTQNGWVLSTAQSDLLNGITLELGETVSLAVVNTQQTAEILVTKTISGAAAPANWTFTLTSSVPGCAIPAGTTNPATTPGAGGTASFAGLPVASSVNGAPCTYAVAENTQAGYVLNAGVSSPLSGITVAAGATTPVSIRNDHVRVRVQKTLSSGVIVPGGMVTYSVVVTNAGTVAANPVAVSDPIPVGLTTPFTWTCASSAGTGACGAPSGSGALATTANLPAPNDAVTYTITATVGPTPPASVANTATITPPGAGVCSGPCSSTATTGAAPVLNVHKSTTATVVTPGGNTVFTVTVNNPSANPLSNVQVSDPIGPGFSAYTWTCAGSGGAFCPAPSGSGAINQTIALLAPGATLTYTITATALANPPAVVTNTFTASPPAGSGAVCAGGNAPPCSSSATIPATPIIEIIKSTTTTSAVPGGSANYTINVSNVGSTAANNTVVSDPLPAGITAFAWTCTASGGAVCPNASGSGAINETIATLPSGGSVSYAIVATLAASLPASVVNTATATPPTGGLCSDGVPPPCVDTAPIGAVPVVHIGKTSGALPITAGGTVTYQVNVHNDGSVPANGIAISDPIPAGLTTPFTWTCATTSGTGACGAPSGSGAIATTANLPAPGDAVTYTITATVVASPPGTVTNTATVTPPATGICNGPCSGTASNSTINVTLAKSVADEDGNGVANAAENLTYTIALSNAGSAAATNVSVTETVPVGTSYVGTGEGWTCGGVTAGSTCTQTVASVPPGVNTATLTFTVHVEHPFAPTLTSIDNVVIRTGDTPPACPGADPRCASLPIGAVVSITKSVAEPVAMPGGTLTYTIEVDNFTGVAAGSTTVADPLPAGITAFAWTCAASGGATCPNASGSGAVNQVIPAIPAGGQLIYTVTATVSATPPASIVNTATLTPAPGNSCDDNGCASTVTIATAPIVRVEKSTTALAVIPNSTVTYTVTVTNTGNSPAGGTVVHDPIPADFGSASWTCAGSGGAVCPNAGGSGDINETIAVLPAGGVVTYTVTAVATATPSATVVNTVTVTPPPSGECDGGDCSASTSTPAGALTAMTVTKDDGATTYTPGGSGTYTIVVTNAGPSTANNVSVNDPFPAGVTLSAAVTCTPAGAAACGTITGAAGATGFSVVGATIAAGPGNSVTYTVPVAFAATMTQNPLVNNVTVTQPDDPSSAGASDSDTTLVQDGLGISKTDGSATYTPGGSATYTVVVTNAGPSNAANVSVSDALPAGVTLSGTPTCIAAGTATCGTITGTAGGTTFSATAASIAAGAANTLTYTVPVQFAASMTTNPLVNTVTATDPGDPTGATATDTDTLAAQDGLSISKTDGSATYTPGGTATYTVVVTNAGPSNAAKCQRQRSAAGWCHARGYANLHRSRYGNLRHDHRHGRRHLVQCHRRQHRCGCGEHADVYGASAVRCQHDDEPAGQHRHGDRSERSDRRDRDGH
jgi:uncharacterized repeat protein (TIGR01451 family)